jgi:DedD protein
MSDDRYHEFHLEGKQLVFLFMAAMAVVVVSFLCGVMVGRGVRAPQSSLDLTASADALYDPTSAAVPLTEVDDIERAALAEEAPSADALTYFARLSDSAPVSETLAREPERLSVVAPAPPAPAPPPAPAAAPPAPERTGTVATIPESSPAAASAPPRASTVAGEPSGGGFAVQVMSVASRAEAETVARRLASKGYPSFVQPTSDGRFRVRVGKYPDRRQADVIARRLEREEKFNEPWVDR